MQLDSVAQPALSQLASTGVVGAVLALALIALWLKDRDLRAESVARVEDAQRMLDLAMKLQKELTLAVTALTEVAKELKLERERLLREQALRVQPTPIAGVQR